MFPAGFVKPSGRPGYATITFEIDDENRSMIEGLLNSPVGKPFLVVAYDIGGKEGEEIKKMHKEPERSKNNLLKQMHAIIGEYSLETGVEAEAIKKILRVSLKHKGKLNESMSELDESGLATAIYLLRTTLHPNKFDYSAYLNESGNQQP